jgi:hypothetical protein
VMTQLVMQLAGQQLLSKLLAEILEKMTPEQKTACAEALYRRMLSSIEDPDNFEIRNYVTTEIRAFVHLAGESHFPEMMARTQAEFERQMAKNDFSNLEKDMKRIWTEFTAHATRDVVASFKKHVDELISKGRWV